MRSKYIQYLFYNKKEKKLHRDNLFGRTVLRIKIFFLSAIYYTSSSQNIFYHLPLFFFLNILIIANDVNSK